MHAATACRDPRSGLFPAVAATGPAIMLMVLGQAAAESDIASSGISIGFVEHDSIRHGANRRLRRTAVEPGDEIFS